MTLGSDVKSEVAERPCRHRLRNQVLVGRSAADRNHRPHLEFPAETFETFGSKTERKHTTCLSARCRLHCATNWSVCSHAARWTSERPHPNEMRPNGRVRVTERRRGSRSPRRGTRPLICQRLDGPLGEMNTLAKAGGGRSGRSLGKSGRN